MAAEVVNCISTGIFNKEPIQCFRALGNVDNFVFYDEEQLKTFMQLSDGKKMTVCCLDPPLRSKCHTLKKCGPLRKILKASMKRIIAR